MRLKMFKQLVCAGLLSSAILFSGTSEAGIVTDRFPLTCYVDHHVDTFDNINGRKVGYIDANVDWINVYEYRDGWVRASYNGLRSGYTRWFRVNEICADTNYSNRGVNVRGAQTVYTTKDSNTKLGSVSNNESVIVLADNGNRAQILYRLDNGSGYKMGWVPSSSVASGGGNNKTKGDINGDGEVNETDVNLLKEHWENDRGYIPEGDMDNNGKIDIYDVMKLTEEVYDKPKPNPTLQELINRWNGQRWTDGYSRSKSARNSGEYLNSGAIQCKEFASYVFNILYKTGYVGGGSTSSNYYNWRLNNVPSSIYKVDEVSQNTNASSAKAAFQNLFQKAQPGDFIQIKRGHGGAHSAIFVERTNNGIKWFDANADGNNGIKLQTYTYDDLVATKKTKSGKYYQYNVAMSLYRAK